MGYSEEEYVEAPEGVTEWERFQLTRRSRTDRRSSPVEQLPPTPAAAAALQPAPAHVDDVRFPNWF